MRISTQQIHKQGIQNIVRQQIQLTHDQNHISTGKRIDTPSDDPVGASKVNSLKQQIAITECMQENAKLATGRLELEDSILERVTNVLQRIRELTIQGANGTNSALDRKSIATELTNRLEEIQGLINTADGNGDYLFAGYQSQSQPFTLSTNATYIYNGDDGQLFSEVSPGLSIPITDSGLATFASIPSGNGTFAVAEPATPNLGTAIVQQTGLVDSVPYVADDYTLTFVTNSSGQVGVAVVGASSGQVLPPPPAVLPGDAPAYTPGQSIQFNGLQIQIVGTPQVGDGFVVTPSVNQNILTTVQDLANAMLMTGTSATADAHFRNALNRAFPAIDQALETVTTTRITVGSRLNTLDTVNEVNQDYILHSKTMASSIEDLDYAEAITQFESRSVALQAAQQSFVRIQNLSLFNYMS